MTELQKKLYKELYRRSLYDFVKDFWNIADPSKFVDGHLIQFYCETFQYMCRSWVGYEDKNIILPEASDEVDIIDVREGKNKLNINLPPRHTKSMIFNVFGPVWLWTYHPVKAVSVSHTAGLADNMNTKRKRIIDSEKYKDIFTDIVLTKNTATSLVDSRGGELYSINRNAFTGYGGDVIINDDLTNAESARKDKEEMNNAWSYYRNTMPSRVNDINKCIIMNIQQRLAPNDITGHILKDEKLSKQYTFIVLRAILPKKTYLVCPISGDVFVYEKGQGLWEERFGNYESLRIEVGESVFQTQYLQNPVSSDKTIIKEDMIYEMDMVDVPDIARADMIYASHDFPVKDKDSSDFLGSLVAYRVGKVLYIIDCLEKRMAFVKSIQYVKDLDNIFPGIIQVIEDKANGSPIIQQLKDEIAGMQPFNPGTQSKMTRLESASIYMNSGNVVFVRDKIDLATNTFRLSENLQNLKDKLLSYPFVEHDDIIDAFSMMVSYVFLDRKNAVYGRTFNEYNIEDLSKKEFKYTNTLFNKEGDTWKVIQVGIEYGEFSKIYVIKEDLFKANIPDGVIRLKKFSPNDNVFLDCSDEEIYGMYNEIAIEHCDIDDFAKSVAQLNVAFAKRRVIIDDRCKLLKADIDNFKYDKTKDNDNVRFKTEKDGFVKCLRVALDYNSIDV